MESNYSAKGGKGRRNSAGHGATAPGEYALVKSPQPAHGPGWGLKRLDLRKRWQNMKPQQIVVFSGHSLHQMGEKAVFSNFYDQSDTPFDFVKWVNVAI